MGIVSCHHFESFLLSHSASNITKVNEQDNFTGAGNRTVGVLHTVAHEITASSRQGLLSEASRAGDVNCSEVCERRPLDTLACGDDGDGFVIADKSKTSWA